MVSGFLFAIGFEVTLSILGLSDLNTPSIGTMKVGQNAKTPAQWTRFIKKYRAEMATPENSHAIELLASLSRQCNFSVGCYCENEAHCHRSILRQLLADKGAKLEPYAIR